MKTPSTIAGLGQVLELRLERDGKRWSLELRDMWLCADATRQGLWIVPAPKKHEKFDRQPAMRSVARVYEAWSQFEPLNVSHHRVRLDAARYLGRGVKVAYRSDKWTGREDDYEHDFRKPGPRVTKLGGLYRITGKGVRVTPGGVVG